MVYPNQTPLQLYGGTEVKASDTVPALTSELASLTGHSYLGGLSGRADSWETALKGELTLEFGSCISELIPTSDHDTVTSPSGAAVFTRGLSSASQDVSTKGVMPAAWGELLSTRDRGVDKSGVVLTSGMKRRVPRKSIKLAKPIISRLSSDVAQG
jgi:hypothetical protein